MGIFKVFRALRTGGSFDEATYLECNPDVAAAVARGEIKSGLDHYRLCGRHENRPLHPSQTRRGIILRGLDVGRLRGVEIGPLDRPLVKRSDGPVVYVDHAPKDDLLKHYASDKDVDPAKLVAVDAIWGQQTLKDALGGETFDYVVASHVVEHVPDLITWLEEIAAILKPGGTVRLIVPDKRFSFDYFRNPSQLADLIDARLWRARKPLPRMILDHFLMCRPIDAAEAWRGRIDEDGCPPQYKPENAIALARRALEQDDYVDTHCWVFTPSSFATLFAEATALGLISYRCDWLVPTRRNCLEFFIAVSPSADTAENLESWRRAAADAASIRKRR